MLIVTFSRLKKLTLFFSSFGDDQTNSKTLTFRQFLASNPDINRKYLPVPDAFECHNEGDNEDNGSDFFVLEDGRNLGYRQDILHPDRGQGSDPGVLRNRLARPLIGQNLIILKKNNGRKTL